MTTRIVSTSNSCGGRPQIDGTRMTVRAVLEFLAGGDSVETLIDYLPYTTRAALG